ncbi:N-acyl homoserine lactonase [bioreactor metagenome]|uniref:N-acyl homoserine lactonase n=1 Tax=bioreactor metagenome TaxID=1076179 RepID=A0A644Y7Q3_9ZZZZ
MNLVINPIQIAKLRLDKGLMTYFMNYGEMIWIAVNAWLIKHPDGDVLVDAGAYQEDMKKYWHEATETIQTVEAGLAAVSEKPEDIKHLIITHLHFDHALNARLFKNATVYVQKKEFEFMLNPHPMMAALYNPDFIAGMKVVQIDGEAEIVPGIRVFPVPGHTPGAQAVEIDTAAGKAVISGFCSIGDVFAADGITPGIHVDALAAFDGVLKVKSRADIIIPQHDPEMAARKQIP